MSIGAVCERLAGSLGYPDTPMNPPPAEQKSNVIAFSLTDGCSRASCTFCNMYERDSFSVKPIDEFVEHVDRVTGYYERNAAILGRPERIFVGAGNALAVETAPLLVATQYALMRTAKLSGEVPRRLALYGNVRDVLKQGEIGMFALRCGGLCGACSINRLGTRRGLEVLYLGVESGNSKVLSLGGKGYGKEEVMIAAGILNVAKVRPSVMIMPGLGGIAHTEEHVHDTAEVLNELHPEWVTFIGLTVWGGTPYAKWMRREEEAGNNRRLTPLETVEQTARMIERLRVPMTVGVHGDQIHRFGHNPVEMGSVKILDNFDARMLANSLRYKAGLPTVR